MDTPAPARIRRSTRFIAFVEFAQVRVGSVIAPAGGLGGSGFLSGAGCGVRHLALIILR